MSLFDAIGTILYLALVIGIATAFWRFLSPLIRVGQLSERWVLITGCDTGFGRSAALRLQARGMKVIAGCLTSDGLASLQAEAAKSQTGTVVCVSLDVTKDASVAAASAVVAKTLGNKGALHALINNAGVLRGGLVDTMPIGEWSLQLEVNVLGIARITKAMIPHLFAGDASRVINVASVAGIFATESTCAYNASKFAVVGVTDSMRRELSSWGIGVTMILPGIMNTPLWSAPLSKASQQATFDSLTPAQKEFYGGADFFERAFNEARELVGLVGGNPERVVDAMEECVICKFAPTRRYVGHDTWAFRLLALVPDVVGDWMWASRHKLLGKQPVLPKGVVDRFRSSEVKKQQ
jgi:NAD(P)-dependent dehydrogenase (short-subunit alcohol dehydrogenase family)